MKNPHGIISEFKYYLLESFFEALSKMLISEALQSLFRLLNYYLFCII